jgi:hypothetical protein
MLSPPLSLALSRKGRGDVFFEYTDNFLAAEVTNYLPIPILDAYIPSPLAGEGQGEGDKNP